MKVIEVNNLSFSYEKNHEVINDISFSLDAGSYVSLIGKNGSGKSTIAKLLVGLLPFQKGSIKIFDMSLNKDNVSKIRERVGIVFQNPDNQFIASSVADDIAFGLENRCIKQSEMDKIILDVATKVNMEKFLDKEPENLSGGQKQRVAIATVLALKSDVIIFDEATSMLDPKGKKEILNTIKDLRKENPNLTIISITHDVEEAFSSDRVIVLDEGKIVFDLAPQELKKHKEELEKIGLDIPFKDRLIDLLNANNLQGVAKDIYD